MSDQGERIAKLEQSVSSLVGVVSGIDDNQKKILDNYHHHEVDSEKYRLLIDGLVEEKRVKVARMEAVTQKLITTGVWGTIVFFLGLAAAAIKSKLGV